MSRHMLSMVLFPFIMLSILSVACSPKSVPGTLETDKTKSGKAAEPLPGNDSTGWQQLWDSTLRNARKEARLMIYAGPGMATARNTVIQEMKARYDIEVDMIIAPSLSLVNKIMAERRAGLYIADVFIMGAEDLVAVLFPNDIAEPLDDILLLPEVKDSSLWINGIIPFMDSGHRAIAFQAQVSSRMAYNTSLVEPGEVASFRDLSNPKLAGKIAMLDPTMSGSGASWFYLAWKEMGIDYFSDFIKNQPALVRDSRQLVEWVVRGKNSVGIGVSTPLVNDFRKSGAPINMLPPMKEAREIRGGVSYTGLINKAPHPYAAKILINWILSKEGQTSVSKAAQVASRRLDVPTDFIPSYDIPDPGIKYISRETEEDFLAKKKGQQLAQEIFAPLLGK